MSVDILHSKIRKLKNPSVIDFSVKPEALPPHLLAQEGSVCGAYGRFCRELMASLRDIVPAVRFPFGAFALLGPEGLSLLQQLLKEAGEMGYYVMLDSPEILSPWAADRAAEAIFAEKRYPCDALLISGYIGSDAVKPFVPYCKDENNCLFVTVRSPNRSASELQDLRIGTRLVHGAAIETVNRFAEQVPGKCGYARIGAVASATAPDSLRSLRLSCNRVFLLVDGLDYPSGNAKNCSLAFDRFGFGAAVSAGPSVTCAWREGESGGTDYIAQAHQAAERMKRNITRYITIL